MNFDNCFDTLDKLKLFQPDAVFISLGGNSITTETKQKKFTEKLCEIVNILKESSP